MAEQEPRAAGLQIGQISEQARKNRVWTLDEHQYIVNTLMQYGCEYVKGRTEYTMLRQVKTYGRRREVLNFRTSERPKNPVNMQVPGGGVISDMGVAKGSSDTTSATPAMLACTGYAPPAISTVLPSFQSLQSAQLRFCIGLDTEYQETRSAKRLLSIQASIILGGLLVRYFFLVDPFCQEVDEYSCGSIPLKYIIADILANLRACFLPKIPVARNKDLIYKTVPSKGKSVKLVDFRAMKESVIPITIICHAGKADLSVFRRSKYDYDILKNVSEIQGGCMTMQDAFIKIEADPHYNYYWLLRLSVRDTMGLSPAGNRSLAALGSVTGWPKIQLPGDTISHMSEFALRDPVSYYEYAMNDSDIVVSFCAALFRSNHAIPVTLSSAASNAMRESIKRYFGVTKNKDYDKIYRGVEMLDEGLIPSKEECLKFLKATRYVPLRENPDVKIAMEYYEEAYTGGFNASFYLGWITEHTTDFDLQNAYPTAMACVYDVDWTLPLRDFPRNYTLTWQDLTSPLIPAVAVGDFDFPDTVYCPNIPVPVKGGMKIYPRHGRNVYMTGPDMYLAIRLGARVTIFRGGTNQILMRNGKPSQCLAYAVSALVQDRIKAKVLYKDTPLIEKTLKTMVNSCYGKTAQNVSPKTRYNASKMGREDAGPSSVTSPYHASYTTALVRCMLIACINQLHDMGYHVYSVTTDGFITDAPTEVVRRLDAYGFGPIFQQGRYTLNQTMEACDANQVWEPKHFNDTFLNITTRGNVAVNDGGVLAHNSYTTGEIKDSRADRDAFIIAVLSREGRLKCPTSVWTKFSDIVERKHGFHVTESLRQLSMNFDYKRCPLIKTAKDVPVHYDSADGSYHVDTVIAEFDTRPFNDEAEFLAYRKTMKNEDCVKVKSDLERVHTKSTSTMIGKAHIGKNLDKKILMSILMGYRTGVYKIPALDGHTQTEIVQIVNSWGIAPFTISDWKNCGRKDRQTNMLPREMTDKTLEKILSWTNSDR